MIEHAHVEGIGNVRIARRKGQRSIRLTVSQEGEVRLSLPHRVALRDGLRFLNEKREWLKKYAPEPKKPLSDGAQIGPLHTLQLRQHASSRARTIITESHVLLWFSEDVSPEIKAKKIRAAALKSLHKQAEMLFPSLLDQASRVYGYTFRSLEIKPLKSRWGSCSQQNDIVLNTYLVQLPSSLIEYVMLHELVHTRFHHHQDSFWQALVEICPNYKERKRLIKKFPTSVFDGREIDSYMQ